MKPSSERIRKDQAAVVVVDLQERLLPAMSESTATLASAVRLLKGAAILKVPVWATEQYRKGLGITVPEIRALVTQGEPVEKLTFSACDARGLLDSLRAKNVADVLLCGIEAHVCVLQSCLDLVTSGFRVFVVADAISSRTPQNRQLAIERMRAAGAVVVSTEMVLFELLGQAGTPAFKQILELIR